MHGGQVTHFHGVRNFNNMTNAFSTLALSNPNAVSSTDVTPTVSEEEKAQMQKLSLVFCKWCERCKSGMFYVQTLQRFNAGQLLVTRLTHY